MSLPDYDTNVITRQLYDAAQSKRACSIKLVKETGSRVIHPYGVCRTKQDKIVIICWQEYGYSGKSKGPGYRSLMLMECASVKLLPRSFFVRDDFDPADPLYVDWVFHI